MGSKLGMMSQGGGSMKSGVEKIVAFDQESVNVFTPEENPIGTSLNKITRYEELKARIKILEEKIESIKFILKDNYFKLLIVYH